MLHSSCLGQLNLPTLFNAITALQQPLEHFSAVADGSTQHTKIHKPSTNKKGSFSRYRSNMSLWLFLPTQRFVWWTVVPTDHASVVCVSARKAGQDQNVSRGTVTHAALTMESAERASVTATRAGRVNTAPSVSHCDTYITAYLRTLDRRV